MKTRMIYTDFWKDNYISNLSGKEKLTFLYLLTNESVSICGMYQLPDKHIKIDCDLTQPELEFIKEKFIKDGKFYFINGWVKILNYEKYNNYAGKLNLTAIEKERALIPSEVIQYRYSIDRVFETPNTLNNHNHNHNINLSNKNIERVVKRETYSSISDINDKILQEIADKYKVPLSFVKSKYDDMVNWQKSKGKVYKDYRAALMNWVKADALKIITGQPINKFSVTKV